MKKRLKTEAGKLSYRLRMHTVEPVFGSLQQYYGLRRINVGGKNSAAKVMLMSATAFNLKKWLKNIIKSSQSIPKRAKIILTELVEYLTLKNWIFTNFSPMSLSGEYQTVISVYKQAHYILK